MDEQQQGKWARSSEARKMDKGLDTALTDADGLWGWQLVKSWAQDQ